MEHTLEYEEQMVNLKNILKKAAIATAIITAAGVTSGCATTPSQESAFLGYGLRGISTNPNLNARQRDNALGLSELFYFLSSQESNKEIFGRKRIPPHVVLRSNGNYRPERCWEWKYPRYNDNYEVVRENVHKKRNGNWFPNEGYEWEDPKSPTNLCVIRK